MADLRQSMLKRNLEQPDSVFSQYLGIGACRMASKQGVEIHLGLLERKAVDTKAKAKICELLDSSNMLKVMHLFCLQTLHRMQ